eukprot:191904-Pyramimonas_sp.AAC.1
MGAAARAPLEDRGRGLPGGRRLAKGLVILDESSDGLLLQRKSDAFLTFDYASGPGKPSDTYLPK